MSTFAEIAKKAAGLNQRDMLGDVYELIAELAEALERFEYNVARGLGVPGEYLSIEAALAHLRAPLPTPETS